jgi:hypothetical protein
MDWATRAGTLSETDTLEQTCEAPPLSFESYLVSAKIDLTAVGIVSQIMHIPLSRCSSQLILGNFGSLSYLRTTKY